LLRLLLEIKLCLLFAYLGKGLFNGTNHVKGILAHVIILSFQNLFKSLDGIFNLDKLAIHTGKDLGYGKGL
jgi:hypothetical protein